MSEDGPVHDTQHVEVDGQVFRVTGRRDEPGQYDYEWVNGPNPDYGFSVGASDNRPFTTVEHEEAIRDFLAQVDPRTGYIED